MGAPVHCLLIHQAYAGPEDPGGTRHNELARHLADGGIYFTVVTSNVNYLTGRARESSGDGPATGNPAVVYVKTPAVLHRSFTWRITAFIIFAAKAFFRAVALRSPDVVLGTSPQIFQALSAWAVAALKGAPFLLEVRDLWPEFAISMGVLRSRPLIGLARWVERFLYRRADAIVVNSPAYETYLVAHGVPKAKVFQVPNGVDTSRFPLHADGARFRKSLGLGAKDFLVVYLGNLGMANDLKVVIEAAALLSDRRDVCFCLAGDGKERARLEKMAKSLALQNVVFPGAVPKNDVPEVLAASDACVATLMPIPAFRMTYPNKVFDYMAAGKPVILAIDGVIREVVEAAGCGIVVPPGDAEALANAVGMLAESPEAGESMGRRGREYVSKYFDRADQARQLGEILRGLV